MAFVFENTAPRFEFEGDSKDRFVFEGDKPSTIAKAGKYLGEQAVATGELAMSLASGMAVYVPSKIAGAVGSALGADPRQVEEWFQTEFLPVYQPKTKRGKQAVAPIEKLFEWGMLPAKKIGEIVEKNTGSRDAGYAAETAAEFATFGAVGKIGRGLKSKIKPKVTPEKPFKPEGPETQFIKKEFQERFIIEEKPIAPSEPKFVAPEPTLKPKKVETQKFKAEDEFRGWTGETERHQINLYENKKLIGQASYSLNKEGIAKIGKVSTFKGTGSIGIKGIRELRRQVQKQNPKIKSFIGDRIDKLPPKSETLYSGIPIHKAGKVWTKNIGEPIWDKAVMKGIPKLLEKIPGGKAINRAFLYDYRGNLPKTDRYISSMEDMKRAQSIGREYAIDLGKRLQAVPEESQLRMGEYITTKEPTVKLNPQELKLAQEAKSVMLDLGKQAVDTGLLNEKTFFKNAGQYMPRLYTSKEFQGLLTKYNLTKPNRLDLSRFKQRKDIPKEIRKEMGEILTPGYPIAKGISQLTHDISTARFFNGIASNPEWATGKTVRMVPDDWKQLPSNKKLGKLSEANVHPEIFQDLQEAIRVMETPEKVWRKALGVWKYGKVIVSPKTHARNLLSNSVLAHLGGMPMYEQPIYLTKAAVEMRRKGEYWKQIKQEGGNQHTFTEGELNQLFDKVEGQMGGIKAGSIPEKLGVIGDSWSMLKKGGKKAADLYQAEEQWFKTAKFIHNIERKGMTPKEAWKDAEKWLFNYSKITRFQEKYRSKWYGAPFATFTFKAMPRVAEAMIKTPWRFVLPGAIIYALEKSASNMIGDTKEQEKAKKELRPEWMKGQTFGIPNFARMPFVDEWYREYYLNLTYILPWGDIGEAGNFGFIPGGIMPFSQPFLKEPMQQILNYDSFWKENIVKEKDVAGLKGSKGKDPGEILSPFNEAGRKALKIRGEHIAQAMLPTPVIDVTKAIAALRGVPDYKGRLKPPKVVAVDVIAGIKMYPVDYVEQVARQIGKIDPQKGWLARKIHTDIRTLAIKKRSLEKRGKDTSLYDKQIEQKIQQLKGLATESAEIGKIFKKVRGK